MSIKSLIFNIPPSNLVHDLLFTPTSISSNVSALSCMTAEILMAENEKNHILLLSLGADCRWMTPDMNMKLGLLERAYFCSQYIKKLGWCFASFFCSEFLKNLCFVPTISAAYGDCPLRQRRKEDIYILFSDFAVLQMLLLCTNLVARKMRI